MSGQARDYVPISHTYPSQKPFMDENGKRKLGKAPDLRVRALNQAAAKRACLQSNDGVSNMGAENHQPSTDFSQFNQSIRAQQQQQQSDTRTLVTLEDLLPRPAAGGRQTQQEQLAGLKSLDAAFPASQSRDGFSRPPPHPAAPGVTRLDSLLAPNSNCSTAFAGVGAQAAAAAAAAAEIAIQQPPAAVEEAWDLRELLSPPWDWSFKSRLKLASDEPLQLLQEAAQGGLQHAAAIMTCPTSDAGGDLQERLMQALVQWQHPADSWQQQMLAALQLPMGQPVAAAAGGMPATVVAAAAGAAILKARVVAWREALRGLMGAVRHGCCPVACVVNATACRQTFSVLFAAGGVLGCPEPHALVSRANKQLQKALAVAGAQFTAVPAAPGRAASKGLNAPELLLVRGARKVHALYLALLQQPWCMAPDQPDVPLLLAPLPFWGAVLTPLQLQVLPNALSHSTASTASGGGQQARPSVAPKHYVQLEAPAISPWCVYRLASVLQDQHQDWDMWLTTEPSTSTFNVQPSSWDACHTDGDQHQQRQQHQGRGSNRGRAAAAGAGGLPWHPSHGFSNGISSQEMREVGDSAQQLRGQVVSQLCCRCGQMSARLRPGS